MKKMKTKRFLSLLLALAMSFSLAVPAFAAPAADDPDDGIMPLSQIFAEDNISLSSGYSVGPFTSSPGAGAYIQVWFANSGTSDVTVMLMDSTNSVVLASKTVTWNSSHNNERFVYQIPNPNVANTFYIRFQSRNSTWIVGDVAAAQYVNNPS